MFACCAQGGCCSPMPARVIERNGSPSRLTIPFYIEGCFGTTLPVDHEDMFKIPRELAAKDILETDWIVYMQKLYDINRRYRKGCFYGCMECSCYVIFLPCCLRSFCQKGTTYLLTWDTELREWQKDFNTRVLEPMGCHIKTQSFAWSTYDKDGRHRHFSRWLSIALNAEESENLRLEPHLTGEVDGSCCDSPNEADFCVHPVG